MKDEYTLSVVKGTRIHLAYTKSNISISGITCREDRYMWMAAMGLMETLIIMGVEANIWDDYKG